jgi:hypothetical protein
MLCGAIVKDKRPYTIRKNLVLPDVIGMVEVIQ